MTKNSYQELNSVGNSELQTTVIVAQLRTTNHSVFKTKRYTIESNGKKTFRKHSRTNKRGFSLPWSPHQDYDDQKRVPTLIKPAQQVKPTVFSQVKVLCEKRNFQRFFKEQSSHFPTLGAKKFIVYLDCLQVHIHNIMTKTAPRHSLSQPNKSNLLSFTK